MVRLELCANVAANCQPVQVVYDQAGNQLPIVNVIGPYPVFSLPYGYNNAYLLVSTDYYANEVWISDPTLRGINWTLDCMLAITWSLSYSFLTAMLKYPRVTAIRPMVSTRVRTT